MTFSALRLDYPENQLQPFLLPFWSKNREFILDVFTKAGNDRFYRRKNDGRNIFVYPSDDLIMENVMNGRKSKGTGKSNPQSVRKSSSIQWINVTLSDEDYNELERSEATLEYLAACLLGLVGEGLCISVKPNVERNNISVTIYRPADDNGGGGVGLSAFATDVRDAALVALYKFDTKCGGEFPHSDELDTPNQRQRRFG